MNKDERRIFIQRLDRLLKKMKGLFADTYIKAIEELKGAIRSGVKFEWKDYVSQTAQIEKMLDILAGKTELIIADGLNHSYQSGINAAVNRINQRYEEINAKYKKRRELNQIQKQATQTIRADVAKSNEGKNLKLSSRVWSLQDQAKAEIQILVNNAIAEGKGAKDMRNYVLKYLNNPKLFTMYVRNKETGELELSETAKKMHPGRGVYRDPLKNAERLLRTEMLAAYRRAEIEAYQRTPLVIGYEIKTSGNHTTMKMGKPVPLKDICDRLAGRYPKSFMWTGWHPNCRCILIPITVPDDQLKDFFNAQDEGRAEEWSAQHGVQFPPQIKTWFEDNGKRIYAVAGNPQRSLPQWIEDNKQDLNITTEPKLKVDKSTILSTFYPEKGTAKEKATWLKSEVEKSYISNNMKSELDQFLKWVNKFDLQSESQAQIVIRNLKDWEKVPVSMRKNVETHLSIIKSFDTTLINKEWKNDYYTAINNINQSKDKTEIHRNVEWAYNIIQYSTQNKIDTKEVSTKMPFDIYKKAFEYGIRKDLKDFFDKQTEYYPLLCVKKNSGAYCDSTNKIVNIDLESERYNYDDGLKHVIYHEYGHADYYSRKLLNNKDVEKAFEEIKQLFNKVNFNKLKTKILEYAKQNRIIDKTFGNESLIAYSDIIQSVDKSHRKAWGGHNKDYFNTKNNQLTEFVAHLSELNYQGNGVIKELDPKLWDIMNKLCKIIYKQNGTVRYY